MFICCHNLNITKKDSKGKTIILYATKLPGQKHYKQKSRIFGSQSRLRDSKPRNNALHAFCGIETIELPLRSSHKKSV
ncbi:MAG: hypothetical protein MR852_01880, partial [Treponema sp.]|nr:hypothetical protein [Treponema sp.]